MTALYDKEKQRVVEVEFEDWCKPDHYSFEFSSVLEASYTKKVSTYCFIADLDGYMRLFYV